MILRMLKAVVRLQRTDPGRMKTMVLRLLLSVCLLLTVSLCVTCHQRTTANKVAKAQAHNVQVLTTQLQHVTRPNGADVGTVGQLEMTIKQLQAGKLLDTETIKALGIETKRLQAVARVETRTFTKIVVQIRDSLIYKDRIVIDSIGLLNFTDGWTTLHGRIKGRVFDGYATHRAKIKLIEYYTPKKFWFIRYGCRERNFAATSDNPRDSITSVSYSKVVK